MKNLYLKNVFIAAVISVSCGFTNLATAYYSIGGVIFDPAGNNANATDLASVSCPDGTDHFSAAIQDTSPPVQGLLMSLHILNENVPANTAYMATVTDGGSGDGMWSEIASIYAGAGKYYISADKTNAGSRVFTVGWDCRDVNNNSLQMTINVLQVQ